MRTLRIFMAIVFLLTFNAWADSVPVGTVKTVSGDAFIVTGGNQVRAALGSPVYLGSQLKTGAKSSLGIVFKDATVTSFGSDTELTVDDYLFEPSQNKQKFATRLLKGSMNYLSGAIAKLQPQSVSLKTPTGTLGVRGTHILVLVGIRSFVTLIADPDGRVGKLLIQGSGGQQLIETANFGAELDGSTLPSAIDPSLIELYFSEAIAALPMQPVLPMSGTDGAAGALGSTEAAIGGISGPVLSIGAIVLGMGLTSPQGSSGTTGTTGTR